MKIPMHALQQGAAAGVILIVLKLVAYLLGIEAMTSPRVVIGSLMLVVVGMFLACSMERQAADGAFTFGEAFVAALVAAATTTFLGLGVDVVLGSIIDPDLSSKMMDFTMQEFEASGVFQMVPEDQVEGMLADLEWAMKPAGQALSWALGILIWGVISLIVGAIMKRPDPSQF
jgi:hypothetical protein